MQSKTQSLIETLLNIGSGFVISLILQFVISWWYDLPLRVSDNVTITLLFTVVSVIRSYFWRRLFNRLHHKEKTMQNFKPLLAGRVLDTAALAYPMLASPKLDGIRAVVIDSVVYSRNLKPIPNPEVQRCFGRPEFNGLDGELICGDPTAKDCYRVTNSAVMSKDGAPEVTFHVFDCFRKPDDTFEYRLSDALDIVRGGRSFQEIHVTGHVIVSTEEDLLLHEEMWLDQGYEGAMLRSRNGRYKMGRSTDKEGILLKLKRFTDSEAQVIGFEELLSNQNEATKDALGHTERSSHKENMVPMGTLGALIVKDHVKGVEFNIGTGFDAATRQKLWDERDTLVGQFVKYKHFEIGSKDKPRFPVFLGFRDAIDL